MATMKHVVMNQKYGNNKILFLEFFAFHSNFYRAKIRTMILFFSAETC